MFSLKRSFQKHWFNPESISANINLAMINERALRARAGLIFLIPVILLFIRSDHGDHNELIVDTITGTIVPREYGHTFAHALIFFVMYEMIMPMFISTAHLSTTAVLGTYLTHKQQPIYQPMHPKVFAWSLGLILAILCQISLYYTVMQSISFYFLATCLLFMWLEATCGICAGCYIHHILVRFGIIKDSCDHCSLK